MRAFTIKVREDANMADEHQIIGHIELAIRQGNNNAFPVIPLGHVNKRPEETEVTSLPERFFKINLKSRAAKNDLPNHITDIKVSTIDDRGRRFGLWDDTYVTEDGASMAFVYLAPVNALTRARLHDANQLKYDGVLIEGFIYHPEKRTDRNGTDKWTYSCPSILFAEKDKVYQIDWYDLVEEVVKETLFRFDGNELLIDAVHVLEKTSRKDKDESTMQFIDSADEFRKDAKRHRDNIEQKKKEREAKRKQPATRKASSSGEWEGNHINLAGVSVKDATDIAEAAKDQAQ